MRAWLGLALLLCAGAARADMSAKVTPGEIIRLPATDGRRIATQLTSIDGLSVITFVDVRSGRSHDERIRTARVWRRLARFRPMQVREVSADYDADHARLRVGGRTLDLTIRDFCMGEERERTPRTVTVWQAADVALVEYWSNAGSCMCDDPTLQKVVAHGRAVEVS